MKSFQTKTIDRIGTADWARQKLDSSFTQLFCQTKFIIATSMSLEKFCLKWNDFEKNVSSAFKDIRDERDFFDVTLACEDEQLEAHKVILSACSPFFKKVLRHNKHPHPLLYLRGVSLNDMKAVLNFMYHGEVNVAQDELNSFLQVAEDLKVKGEEIRIV